MGIRQLFVFGPPPVTLEACPFMCVTLGKVALSIYIVFPLGVLEVSFLSFLPELLTTSHILDV